MRTNKKGMAFQTIVSIAIISIVGFILLITLFGPEGFWGKVAHATTGFADDVFAKMPGKGFKKPVATASQDMKDAAANLWTALKDDNPNPCIVTYPNLPKDFNDFTIKLMQKKDEITIVLINSQGQIIDMGLDIPEKELCVVAGNAAEAFYHEYIKKPSKKQSTNKYITVNSITITEDDIIFDGKTCDYEDFGILFHNDEKHTCLFPVDSSIRDYSDCGLDNDEVLEKINLKEAGPRSCISTDLPQETREKCAQMTQCVDIQLKQECQKTKSEECNIVCYWDDECKHCNALAAEGCKGYDEDNCRINPCGFEEDCEWVTRWYWTNYCKPRGEI